MRIFDFLVGCSGDSRNTGRTGKMYDHKNAVDTKGYRLGAELYLALVAAALKRSVEYIDIGQVAEYSVVGFS